MRSALCGHVCVGDMCCGPDLTMSGDRACRLRILKRFVQDSEGKTGADLERYYGGAVSLFLTRISSWFRAGLSYELSCGGSGSNIAGLGIQVHAVLLLDIEDSSV